MSGNPKSFYNQTEYHGGPSSMNAVHKPDEVSASDLLSPPPYSPDIRKSSDSGTYGSTANQHQQEHAGLLGQSTSSSPYQQDNASNTLVSPKQSLQALPSPHQEYQHTSIPVWNDNNPNGQRRGRRSNGDPGCCRNWCKYIFAAILVWLVLLKYGAYIFGGGGDSHIPYDSSCSSNSLTWEDLPRVIDFDSNIEIILDGYVSGGHIVITPIEDRHGGKIITDIKYTPSSLQDRMTYSVEQAPNDIIRLVLKMPTKINIHDDECININMEIKLPYSADIVRLDVHNVDISAYPFIKDIKTVDIKNANGKIRVDRWTGNQFKLRTTNGEIKLGRIISDESIYVETTSNSVILSENMEAKNRIDIKNANGHIKTLGAIQADSVVNIQTTNGNIHIGSVLSDNVFLKTSNSGILVDYIKSKVQVIAESSNGPISISVAGEKNNKVVVGTSTDPINLHMTNEFEGRFVMRTSNGQVNIDNDDYIEFQDNESHLKRGERHGSGNKGDLNVSNSNADINVSFDI